MSRVCALEIGHDHRALVSSAGIDCVIVNRPPVELSRRALIDLTVLEFKAQVRLEYLILIHRIDTDVVPNSAGAD